MANNLNFTKAQNDLVEGNHDEKKDNFPLINNENH
jgi:hypothetical protein